LGRRSLIISRPTWESRRYNRKSLPLPSRDVTRDLIMPWLIEAVKCPTCQGRHNLCLDGMPKVVAKYEFTCPRDGVTRTVVTFDRWGKEVTVHTPGAVKAMEAKAD